jgi:hypothetical protein
MNALKEAGMTSLTSRAPRRPGGVTLIAVIMFLQAIAGIGVGIALIVERNNSWFLDHTNRKVDEILAYGVVGIVWGVIVLLVGMGIWWGRNWARYLVGVVEALSIASGVYLLARSGSANVGSGVAQIAMGLVILYLLFNNRASGYFGRR